ncbi:hypothetical protein [[Kitasatospora] papulosa]|uniref:hypothetical protein n=1 Tax=[Kitasatospora] papulosa TaxID=1464011 RepID=UPI002E2E15DF|nr:hypothetical protein [[Kitasatospora] papulosa]
MLTLDQYRDDHGDPTWWSTADIDSYLVIGDIAPPEPLPYTYAEIQAMAADYQRSADDQKAIADRLAGEGHDTAAGIWRRGARGARELAAAARMGWPAFEAHLNGW